MYPIHLSVRKVDFFFFWLLEGILVLKYGTLYHQLPAFSLAFLSSKASLESFRVGGYLLLSKSLILACDTFRWAARPLSTSTLTG